MQTGCIYIQMYLLQWSGGKWRSLEEWKPKMKKVTREKLGIIMMLLVLLRSGGVRRANEQNTVVFLLLFLMQSNTNISFPLVDCRHFGGSGFDSGFFLPLLLSRTPP